MATTEDVEYAAYHPDDTTGVSRLAQAEGWPTFSDPARVRRLFTAPGTVGVVARQEGVVVGGAHLLTDGHHGYLTFLAVVADRRRQGIARRLVEDAFGLSGAERIDLLSGPESLEFYRSWPHFDFAGFRLYPPHVRDGSQPTA